MPTAFNWRSNASTEPNRLTRFVYCRLASAAPAARSAGVAFWSSASIVMSWFRIAMANSGGNCWPCAAALAFAPVKTWSNSLCLMSKPLALTMTGSPNSAFIVASGVAFVPAETTAGSVAAVAEITPAISAADRINFNFIRSIGLTSFVLVQKQSYNVTTFTLLMSVSFFSSSSKACGGTLSRLSTVSARPPTASRPRLMLAMLTLCLPSRVPR